MQAVRARSACDNGREEDERRHPRGPGYPTLEDVIGNTPLVRLVRLPGAENERRGNVILGKLEGNNPAGSVKDRPAISMIRAPRSAARSGPGDTLIEATSATPASRWRWPRRSAATAWC